MHAHHALAALLVTLVVPAQTITLAEGTPTALRIATVPEASPNAPDTVVLQDVELLPLEVSGRTLAQEHDPGRSRRVVRLGVARVELPGGGRVFRYQRSSRQFWGFLHVAADGAPRVLLERAGVGPTSTADPFVDRIAVAADGLHAVIALAAGGLHVVRLDGGTYAGTSRPDWTVGSGVVVIETSVMVGASVFFYQTAGNHLWRCDLIEGSTPVEVSPPPVAGAFLKDQMVLSRDGTRLVFLHGPQLQQRLWQVGVSGPASVLPPPPSKYEEPGYLPEDPGEPAMLLNDDGTRLFFVEADVRDELFLLDTSGQVPALHLTSDAIFQPYIGVHILPKFTANSLLVAVGDPAQMDWYRASLSPGGGTVTNLTGTGSLVPPFVAGALNPVQAADAGSHLLVAEQLATGMALRRIDASTGAQIALQQDLLAPPQYGSATSGPSDLLVRAASGDSLYGGANGSHFVTLPQGLLLTPPVQGPYFAGAWMHLPIQWGVAVFYTRTDFVTGPIEYDLRQITMTALGGVVAVGDPVRYLAMGTYVVMNRPMVPFRLCLSGAGG